jgi:DNA polymerase-3 subunit chi
MSNLPRVDFYILAATEPVSRLRFACRLTEKAYALKHGVYAHTGSADEARQLDELLWTFRQGSFVPHGLIDDTDDRTPVKIGRPDNAQTTGELLINLSTGTPDFVGNYKRVAEIVDGSEASKQAGRERFKQYRSMGLDPVTHNID